MADSDLDYAKVTGRFALTVADGEDPGDDPDIVWCDGGTVLIEPLITYTKVIGGSPVPFTAGHSIIEATINASGYLEWRGKPYVYVVDLTSDKVNPQIPAGKATHKVTFKNVTADGTMVDFGSATVRLTKLGANGDGENDLTVVSPVSSAPAQSIYRGERGTSIQALEVDGGDLLYTLSDGTTENAGELPVGPGGSNAGVAGYIGADGPTKTALSASIADEAIQVREGALTPYRFADPGAPMDRPALQAFFDTILHGTANKAEGFIPPGQIDLDGTPIVLTGDSAYSAGKILGAGRTSRNLDGSGTVIRQTANAPIFRLDSGLSGLHMGDLSLVWDGPPTAATDQRTAFVFNEPGTGQVNPTWFNLEFERITILRAYRGWDLVTGAGKTGSVWAARWKSVLLDDLKNSAFELSSPIPVGQPENLWDGVYINNANGAVVSDGPAWNLSACEGSLRGIDVEGWYNTVFRNSGGYSANIEGCHIEHHKIDGTTAGDWMLFDVAGAAHLSVRNMSVAGTSQGGAFGLTAIGQAGDGTSLSLDDVSTGMVVTGSPQLVYGGGHFRLGSVTKLNGTTFEIGTYGDVRPRVTRLGGLGSNAGVLKPESGPSGARPPASVGKGSMFYDETLGKPIFSNGAAWTDAAGTVV